MLPLDLREPAAAEEIVNDALQRFGRIDALLNIAGAVPQIDLFPAIHPFCSVGGGASPAWRSMRFRRGIVKDAGRIAGEDANDERARGV